MNFSNLMKRTKAVTIGGGLEVVLKKWPVDFKEYLATARIEGAEITTKKDVQSFNKIWPVENQIREGALKIAHGVASWGLIDEATGQPAPINELAGMCLARDYPVEAKELILEIENFNSGLDEKNVKP